MSKVARLLVSDSEHDADMLYVSRMFVPDPFIAVELDGQWHGIFSPLEVDRARKQSRFAQVHLDRPWREEAVRLGWGKKLVSIAAAFLRNHGVDRVILPHRFPAGDALWLRNKGFSIEVVEGPFFPQRAVKTAWEVACIRQAMRITRAAMRLAENFLRRAQIGDDGILRHPESGVRLKSKHLRAEIESFLIRMQAVPSHTIVACGRESADPHQTGHGFLYAGRPIIIDIFPRMATHGYWGDMTRTYAKGYASEPLCRMYETIKKAQQMGLDMLKDGANGGEIHARIQAFFERQGYPTTERRGRQVGFFHGTGHGLGLEVHESPRLSHEGDTLLKGNVVTVEPGLYYPDIGGIRLEDVALVQENGAENLTRYPCRLLIP